MKRINNESRVRINVSFDGIRDPETITMTAGQWNALVCALFEAGENYERLGSEVLARPVKNAASKIHDVLEIKGLYRDQK